MRGGRGEVVSSFGEVQGPRWTGKGQTSVRVEILEGGENSLISSYKYMFQRLRDVRDGEYMKVKKVVCRVAKSYKSDALTIRPQLSHVLIAALTQILYIYKYSNIII